MVKTNRIVYLKGLFFDRSFLTVYDKITYKTKTIHSKNNSAAKIPKSTVYEILDVPNYIEIQVSKENPKLKQIKLQTLKGYLVEANKYNTIEEYLENNFGSKSRSNLRRYKNRLEKCFNIQYACYYGNIPKEIYNNLFIALKQLLIRRFEEKKESNYELQHFEEYHSIIYDLILKKEASLYVIYHDKKPISIRINMFKENLGHYIMSCYDIDYSKFHLGSVDMLKNIEWCIGNEMVTYDLLKGYDYYKKDWKTTSFNFYNHIIYDSNSVLSTLYAFVKKIKTKITYKVYYILKAIHFISHYKKVKQFLYELSHKPTAQKKIVYNKVDSFNEVIEKKQIDFENDSSYSFLKKPLYDVLFTSQEQYKDILIYLNLEDKNHFLVCGKRNNWSFRVF